MVTFTPASFIFAYVLFMKKRDIERIAHEYDHGDHDGNMNILSCVHCHHLESASEKWWKDKSSKYIYNNNSCRWFNDDEIFCVSLHLCCQAIHPVQRARIGVIIKHRSDIECVWTRYLFRFCIFEMTLESILINCDRVSSSHISSR